MRERLVRWLLTAFDVDEIEEITRDLRELAAERGPLGGPVYYWTELLKYPVRRGLDALLYRSVDQNPEGVWTMESWWKDTRYAARSLARNPGFSAMAVAIISVSMGATTAIVGVVNGVLLEPLPVDEPDRLVSIWLEDDGGERARMTPGNFVDVSELEGAFSSSAAFGAQTASLVLDGEPRFLRGSRVTAEYFETLGVRPILGRAFRPDEVERGETPVVVLSHHVWQQVFGGDPSIITRTIDLDGTRFDVVGVVPPGVYPTHATVSAELPFTVANQDFFVPLRYGAQGWQNRRSHVLGMIARLAPGIDRPAADARLTALHHRLQEEALNQHDEHFLMTSFTEEVVGDVRFGLLTLLATVGLVLVISVVNVGALFVLRSEDRRPELGIRTALGAPRSRLVRQMLLESVLVVCVASVGAVVVATAGLEVIKGLVPYQIPRLADVTLDGLGLTAAFGLGAVVATTFGLVPSLGLRRGNLAASVGRARQTASVRQRRFQSAVVAIQSGFGVVVLVGAALLSRSYLELRAVDTGFDADDAWAMTIPAPMDVLNEIVREVRGLPGVAAAAVAYDHPLERNWGDGFAIEGQSRSASDPPMMASLRPFGEGYFRTVGIDVRDGRVPDAVDMDGDVAYAVVNRSFADTYLQSVSPVGSIVLLPTAQRMSAGDGRFEVLGVVEDVRFLGPDQPAGPALYVPLSHFPATASTLLVRPEAEVPENVLDGVRAITAGIDPGLGVQRAQRLGDLLDDLLARPRFNMMLLVGFAVIALVLSALGAYGLVGRVVAMRVREIGIQMALGADRGQLARTVLGSAVRPIVLGGALGLIAASGLARIIRSLLFGISPSDPISLAASPSFVLLVGVIAALAPTLKAISIDPASTLRGD